MSEKIHIRIGSKSKRHRLRDLLKDAPSEPTLSHQPGETVAPSDAGAVTDEQPTVTPLPPVQPKPPGHAYRPPLDHEVAGATTQHIELEGTVPPPRPAAPSFPPTVWRVLAGALKLYGLLVLAVLAVALGTLLVFQV